MHFIYQRAFEYFFLIVKCHYDKTWVKEFHDNLESMGFILCIDEKTIIVGKHIGENIIQTIDSSRKVILITTENCLNSDWGLYELEVTRMYAFQRDNENIVIVVIKNDIPKERIPHVLLSI